MRKSTFSRLILFTFTSIVVLQSCKHDVYLTEAPPVADQSFEESFDTLQNAYNKGWRFINRSEDIGVTNWEAGSISGALLPYISRGTAAGMITCDYQATAGLLAVISNWAVSPPVTLQNGDKVVFYTTCSQYSLGGGNATDYANRLQLRFNPHNDGLNVGDAFDPGHFTEVMVDINPSYDERTILNPIATAYPSNWTRFEGTIFGLTKPVKGRFAFRQFIEDGGGNGRGSEIGIDEVSYISVSH